jgi:two-component system LytT family sensor kinase
MAGGLPRSRTPRSLVYSRGVNKLFRFSLAACFWTAVALVFALPSLSDRLDWHVLLASLAHWWSWGALAPAIIAIDDRLPGSSQQRLAAHLGIGLFFTVVYAYMSAFIAAALGVAPWGAIVSTATLVAAWHEMFWSLLVYGLIVGAWEAYRYQQRYVSAELRMERMERNFAAARLNSLRTQLDPHFLFNALNTISAQVEREPRLARNMIEHLGDLLRLSLATHGKPTIPLQEEVAFLDHYLAIQKIRFGSSLRIEINIAPDVQQALVPSMLLQPLVENAIRHGLSPRAGGGSIVLQARRQDDKLYVGVLDDGVGLAKAPQGGQGLGLSVTRERIAGLHPEGSSGFSIHPRPEGGTAVEISFPLRWEGT